MPRWLIGILAVVMLGGCASSLPRAIREPVVDAPPFAAVQAEPAAYHDQTVRWGGTIIGVHNSTNETVIEVLAKELGSQGSPVDDDASQGRFLARFAGFLDPAIYATGRQLTVYGRVVGSELGQIGERSYLYPLVAVEVSHLWREDLYADYYPYGIGYWPYGYRGSFLFGYPFRYGRRYYW